MLHKTPEEENVVDKKFISYQNELLLVAIDACNVEEVGKVLRNCGNLTQEVVNSHCGSSNATALHLAAAKGRKAGRLVKILLSYGAKADISDNIGGIPLHTAALIGNVDAVEALIKAGSDVNATFEVNTLSKKDHLLRYNKEYNDTPSTCQFPFPECSGRTPLHQAVLGGSAECTHLLLQAGANINAQDDQGMTPLLLAGTGIVPGNKREIQRYEEMVELLVQSGANVNVCSQNKRITAMHQAAELGSLRAIKCLLDAKAVLTDMDCSGVTTVLHIAASKGNLGMVDLLLKRGAQKFVNSKDNKGYTPLHRATLVGARDCLALLLSHGGDLAAETTRGLSVMDTIFSNISRPINFLTEILDRYIIPNGANINSSSFKIILDFSILCPHGADRQMDVVMALMDSGTDFQQKQVVRHPLLKAFLGFKWQQLCIFFYLLMVLHFCFVLSVSAFCYLKINAIKKGECNDFTEISVAHKVMLVTAIVWALHFIIQFIMLPRHHATQFQTLLHLTGIIFSLGIAIGHSLGKMDHYKPGSWVIHFMAFVVLNVWIEFMFIIGHIPRWGYYSLMFYQVLRNVIKVLLIFSSLIIGFTLSFTMQFYDLYEFGDIWKSFIKTVVMMTGEYDYEDIFKKHENMMAGNKTMAEMKESICGLKVTSQIIFLLFIILASIVLMNLMVGLAVSDIQELKAEGHTQRLLKQAEFVMQLEKTTVHYLVPRCLRRLFNNMKTIKIKYEITPSEFSPKKTKVSYYLLERIVNTAVQNWRKTDKLVSEYPSSGKDSPKTKLVREYSNISEILPSSPTSTIGSLNLLTVLHQLQLEMAEIKKTLNERTMNFSQYENDDEANKRGLKVKRWTRHFADSESNTSVSVRRLRKANSKASNFVV